MNADHAVIILAVVKCWLYDCAWLVLAAVHEQILGARVPVYVDEDVYVTAFQRLTYHLFHRCNLW